MNVDALLRAVARRRRLVGALLVAAAVATALPLLAPQPDEGRMVLRAAHDLAAGSVLTATDVVSGPVPVDAVPAGVLAAGEPVEGRAVAGAVRAGEVLTDVRLVGPALLTAQPAEDLVAAPVRLADPASAALLRAGDRVDVLAAATSPDASPGAEVVAAASRVLAVPLESAGDEGALVVLAVSTRTAARLAGAAVSSRLSVVVRP